MTQVMNITDAIQPGYIPGIISILRCTFFCRRFNQKICCIGISPVKIRKLIQRHT